MLLQQRVQAHNIINWILISLFLLAIFCISPSAWANPIDQQSTLTITDQQLNIDKQNQELVKKQFFDAKDAKVQLLQVFRNKGISNSALKHAQLDFVAAQAAVEGANIALTDAQETLSETDNNIRALEKNLQSLVLLTKGSEDREDKIISVEANLEFLKRLQQIQNDRVETLNGIKAISVQRLTLEKNWQQELQSLYNNQQQDAQRNYLSEVLANLQKDQQAWVSKLGTLTAETQILNSRGMTNDNRLKKLHLQILEAEENITLIRLKSYLVHIQDHIESLQRVNIAQTSTGSLTELSEQASTILVQLDDTENFMDAKIRFLNMKKSELSADLDKEVLSSQDLYSYSKMLNDLIANYDEAIINLNSLESKTNHFQHLFKLQLQNHLSERQHFPNDWAGWMTLGQKMLQIPILLFNAMGNFVKQAMLELNSSSAVTHFFLIAFPLMLGGWFYLRRLVLNVEINIKQDKQRFSTNIIYILLELVRRNLGSVLFFVMLLTLTLMLEISSPLFIYLLLVFMGFKIALSVARLLLLENTNDMTGADVRLYYRTRWSLLLGWLLSTLVVIAHHLPIAYEAKICIDRLFMVFILIFALQLFKARQVIPIWLESLIHLPRRYLFRVFQLLSFFIPLALIFNAIVGLLGYVELAFAIAKYQAVFILVLAGYLIVRGLLIDAMEYISELFIRYVKLGWLWTQAILKPLDRILRIVLFILSAIFLVHLFHLDNNEQFLSYVDQLLQEKLFTIGGNTINALILCELLIVLSLITWLARWSREFSYRWLYAKARDVGVRNSLSIFTQYASVIISVLIGLKLLGIDLRGFTVVAAAFAAGIGFGMRDLIINFFSGVLLLIERPFRTGDIIALGSYEGEVCDTGMRSMTIKTWDNMEVIVPNADMFTKPFVNWTHNDNIVRTVITLKIHREDDPHKVQHLILDVLHNLKSVTKDPCPEVIMNEMSESLIEMQVRYYVLLTPTRTRMGVRSEVLFAIWDCFKQNNIRAPLPQYHLTLKNNQNELIQVDLDGSGLLKE